MSMFSTSIKYLTLTAVAAISLPSCSDEISLPDYVTSGEDMTIVVPLSVDNPTIQSRADLSEAQLNTVQSLWVATFSVATNQMTSKNADGQIGWVKIAPGTNDIEEPHEITLNTKSGSSYIVAVANVDKKGVLRGAPNDQKPLSVLLDAVETWSDFLNIGVVAPSTYEGINAPETPMAMCGAYTNAVQTGHDPNEKDPSQWQNENIKPYYIPKTKNGQFALTGGAIHLRRPVSQINFNIKSGSTNVRITPNSYSIRNVPNFAWLYERPASAETGANANFGDDCTEESKDEYYTDSQSYSATSSFIKQNEDGSYSFDFWQAESKHNGTAANYNDREAQTLSNGSNTGIFTALCPANAWTPDNMASYVLINCTVDYIDPIHVNDKGEPGATQVWRTGTATYIIHLGYLGRNANDFNCYRNVKYYYEVTVDGIDKIRVEAYKEGDTPGAEGIVTDVFNPTINLDCHYAAFNIQLTDDELKAWEETDGGNYTGFGFMTMTYDNLNGGLKEFDEVGLLRTYNTWDDVPADIKKYIDWVEFRPTTGENTLAAYKPRTGNNSDGRTFNLYDAAKGITDVQKSTSTDNGKGRWYTCFVNEYTYEAANANETMTTGGTPLWYSYVNADPRRFYIRVTRTVSNDGESIYARSKYAVVQNSIQTYYGRQAIPSGTGRVPGAAMGFEAVNEVYGLNMRKSWTGGNAPDNGRYDCWNWADGKQWSDCVDQTLNQTIPEGRSGSGITATTYFVPKAANYTGNFDGKELITNYDPQADQRRDNLNRQRTIEGINSCMNRNRDNNGNGTIESEELRWYVPGVNQYTRITLGANSLGSNALMNYDNVSSCGYTINGTFSYGYDGRYLYYTSGGRVFWAMEGFAVSEWREWGASNATAPGDPVATWQVRCIRNLGTNLANVNQTSQSVKAYTYSTDGTYHRVVPKFYELTNTRSVTYSGNGTGAGQMPLNLMSDGAYNALYRGGFEILSGNDLSDNSGNIGGYKTYINGDPCGAYKDIDGGRWRLPNATELAIMQNEGEFSIVDKYYVSCTLLDFNGRGYKITNTADGEFLLCADSDRLTRSLKNPYHVRCVRDIIQ